MFFLRNMSKWYWTTNAQLCDIESVKFSLSPLTQSLKPEIGIDKEPSWGKINNLCLTSSNRAISFFTRLGVASIDFVRFTTSEKIIVAIVRCGNLSLLSLLSLLLLMIPRWYHIALDNTLTWKVSWWQQPTMKSIRSDRSMKWPFFSNCDVKEQISCTCYDAANKSP